MFRFWRLRKRSGIFWKVLFLLIFLQISLVLAFWTLSQTKIFGLPYNSQDTSLLNNRSCHLPKRKSVEDKIIQLCKKVKRKDVECKALFRGEKDAMVSAKNKTYLHVPSECNIQNLVQNCTTLLRAHEYIMAPVTDEEANYPLAFTIKMHKGASQTEQLLRTIYRPQNMYCIYIDRKAIMLTFNVMRNLSRCFHNVFVVEQRERIVYSSISLVLAEMECMRTLIKSGLKWKYYINLTGQEFPLRTNLEIVRILKALNGANDVESFDFPTHLKKRYRYHHEIRGSNIKATHKSHPPFKYRFDLSKGSAYAILRYEFIQFILNDNVSEEFVSWLNNTYAPEETVFATLNTLPWAPGGYHLEIRHVHNTFLSRAVIWEWDKVKCGGKMVRSVCVLGVDDLLWLLSRPQIIANKFDIEYDPIPIDCMEELIKERTRTPEIDYLNWYYYRNLPHAKLYGTLNATLDSNEYRMKVKEIWLKKQQH